MRRSFVVLTAIALVTVTLGTAVATHNNAGARFTVGDPDPTPAEEPNIEDGLRPIYHNGEVLAPDISPDISFWGDYPRIHPPEQSGLGLGEWVGYINGMVEYVGAAFDRCWIINPSFACEHDPDPLYRVNPEQGDEECDDALERADTNGTAEDPSDDPCNGNDHRMVIDFWPGVRVQGEKANDPFDDGLPGNGFLFPGTYSFYLYLFGAGSGPVAGDPAGPFDYLSADLCTDHLNTLKQQGNIDSALDTSAAEECALILPDDLSTEERTNEESAKGSVQRSAVCMFAPRFGTLSGASDVGDCANIMEFNQFFDDSESSLYFANKPGWYIQSGFIDPDASTLPVTKLFTKDGVRDDVAQIFGFYVNPVRPSKSVICAGPPVATTAQDELDTGIALSDPNDPNGSWTETGEYEYLLEAHDLDIYFGQPTPIIGGEDVETDRADPLIAQVNNLTLPPAIQPLVDAAESGVARASPTVGTDAEPNAPGDNTLDLEADELTGQCTPAGLVRDAAGDPVKYYNYIQSTVNGFAVHDYTYSDSTGLPAESGEQRHNPWNPEEHSFSGSLLAFLDLNNNSAFDGCPPGADPPSAGSPDLCTALIPWDVYNKDAVRDDGRTIGDWAKERGFKDPAGMYFALKVTGPVVIQDEDSPDRNNLDRTTDRTIVITDPGQHCIVGTSVGLTTHENATGFLDLIGVSQSASDDEITQAICGEDTTGERHLIADAFDDAASAGSFSAAIEWTRTMPTLHGANFGPGDGIEVHAIITTNSTGDLSTSDNLQLGSHGIDDPTVWGTWDDGRVTYRWTDVDLFTSDPSPGAD